MNVRVYSSINVEKVIREKLPPIVFIVAVHLSNVIDEDCRRVIEHLISTVIAYCDSELTMTTISRIKYEDTYDDGNVRLISLYVDKHNHFSIIEGVDT